MQQEQARRLSPPLVILKLLEFQTGKGTLELGLRRPLQSSSAHLLPQVLSQLVQELEGVEVVGPRHTAGES